MADIAPLPGTVTLPEFTPEQTAHLDHLMEAVRLPPRNDIRIGGRSTLPKSRFRKVRTAVADLSV